MGEPALARTRTQDEGRLRAVIDDNADFVWRTLRRLGLPADAADDAAQRVFLVASERMGDIAPGAEHAFLFRTAVHIAARLRRGIARRREELRDEPDDDHVDPATELYPWGDAPPSAELAVYGCTTCLNPLMPVGALPGGADAWGVRQLAGNVAEWVLDSDAPCANPPQAETQPANTTDGFRVIKGGDTFHADDYLRAAARESQVPDVVVALGFRCAKRS